MAKKDITSADKIENIHGARYLVRTWFESGKFIRADLFNSDGLQVGTYKTRTGVQRRLTALRTHGR